MICSSSLQYTPVPRVQLSTGKVPRITAAQMTLNCTCRCCQMTPRSQHCILLEEETPPSTEDWTLSHPSRPVSPSRCQHRNPLFIPHINRGRKKPGCHGLTTSYPSLIRLHLFAYDLMSKVKQSKHLIWPVIQQQIEYFKIYFYKS